MDFFVEKMDEILNDFAIDFAKIKKMTDNEKRQYRPGIVFYLYSETFNPKI